MEKLRADNHTIRPPLPLHFAFVRGRGKIETKLKMAKSDNNKCHGAALAEDQPAAPAGRKNSRRHRQIAFLSSQTTSTTLGLIPSPPPQPQPSRRGEAAIAIALTAGLVARKTSSGHGPWPSESETSETINATATEDADG
jgi:hypothetical protein